MPAMIAALEKLATVISTAREPKKAPHQRVIGALLDAEWTIAKGLTYAPFEKRRDTGGGIRAIEFSSQMMKCGSQQVCFITSCSQRQSLNCIVRVICCPLHFVIPTKQQEK